MAVLAKLPGRVEIQEDVVFGTGGGRDLKCDVFLPPDDRQDRVGILILHGGGWSSGDKSQLKGYGVQLARYGYVCVCSEYRLSGEAAWPAQIHDVKAALRWMRANAASLGLDPNRIAVTGNSAGAHLSLMLAATPGDAEFEGEGGSPGMDTSVATCVAIYPPTLIRASGNPDSAIDRLFGSSDVSDATQHRASPIAWVAPDFPPTMLIHGNSDMTVPVTASFEMYRALAEKGAKVEMHIYEGAPHAFDSLPEFGRQVADMIALFVDRQLVESRFPQE
ncbi:MAG TPA: alpha/beta hydrolase [Pseudomonadales bacterium]|nr:alpha/beta hydrolase [Pseudomonadales bacterium]